MCRVAAPGMAQTARTVEVNPKRVYTPTGITVKAGDKIQIAATGQIAFGNGPIAKLGPGGIPWGRRCSTIAETEGRGFAWPAPGLSCWSLFARVGTGDPVEIGTGATFTAKNAGPLRLGLNDNYAGDNSGSFTVQVAVNPPPGGVGPRRRRGRPEARRAPARAPTRAAGAARRCSSPSASASSSRSAWLVFFRSPPARQGRRRARPRAGAGHPARPRRRSSGGRAAPEPVPAVPPILIAPPDPESIDVNIFEVEFVNGLQLRIGYNHFPDGTPVNWRVTQSRKPVAVGSFVAEGGGSTNHYETANLGQKLEGRDTHPTGADVQFDWSINGVPFRYSVRRDPNC